MQWKPFPTRTVQVPAFIVIQRVGKVEVFLIVSSKALPPLFLLPPSIVVTIGYSLQPVVFTY